MIGLLQRVSRASVEIDGLVVSEISAGLVVLVGIERDDHAGKAVRLGERLLSYRVFEDSAGRMNRSLLECGGGQAGLLLVPQFTLAADTSRGNRPGFSTAAAPEVAKQLFEDVVSTCQQRCTLVKTGVFGADMQVSLVNDGPVTFYLRV